MPHKCDRSFDQRDVLDVIKVWEISLDYFPKDPGRRAAIMRTLASLANCNAELLWLQDRVIGDQKWQSTARVRELFCMRFKPADGIEPEDASDDMDANAAEMRYISGTPFPKMLPTAPGDPVAELDMTVWREKLKERLRADNAERNWPEENKPAFKLWKQELDTLEAEIMADAAAAALNRRTNEEAGRAEQDLRLALEQRGHTPPVPDPTQNQLRPDWGVS